MRVRDIWQNSLQIHRKNGFIAYILFIFSTLLACGFIALMLLLPALFVLVFPLFIIPLYFACQCGTRLLRESDALTLGGFFRCYFGYFSEHFSSTFRTVRSILFSLIFYGATLLTSYIVVIPCFYAFNVMDFKGLVDSLNISTLQTSYYEALIEAYEPAINLLLICTTLPSLFMFSIAFLFLADKNSVSLFLRVEKPELIGRASSRINDLVIKHNKKEFYKAYLLLNWPFYLLFVGGFALGGYLGYLYSFNSNSLFTFGLMGALLLSFVIYGPLLLSNKEAIYLSLADKYKNEEEVLKADLSSSLMQMLDQFSKEQEETKKDSDES